ncbi:LamG domain-containing protein [candidate division KSB1 bacterium]|nr:LamG domain-containing protein [candidate division KSB1 bacterium]
MKNENLRFKYTIITINILLFLFIACIKNSTGPNKSLNYAFKFDGIDDFIFVPVQSTPLDTISTEITIECWINVNSYPNIAPRILDRTDSDRGAPYGDRYLLALFEPDSCVVLNLNGWIIKSNPISLNEWIHVAGTYDGRKMKIYVNGMLQNVITIDTDLQVTESDLIIGNNSPMNNRQFDGIIDELHIWSKCKTATEIYDDINMKFEESNPSLLATWNFDEEDDQIIIDRSGNSLLGVNGISTELDSCDAMKIEVELPIIYKPYITSG